MESTMIWECSQRGSRWLISRLEPEGSFRGAGAVGDVYKAPFGLLTTGHVREAERILDFAQAHLLQEDGDLGGAQDRFSRFRTYPHAWFAVAALMCGRFELARPLLAMIQSYYDPATGGFFATTEARDSGQGNQEIMTTSMAGLACLWQGRLDLAESVGNWLKTVYEAQPDLSKGLYTAWHSRSGLITHYPEDEARFFFVDARRKHQFYFHYGISAAFLSALAGATGKSSWIRLAQNFLYAVKHFPPGVLRELRSGKIGWGAAWTYRLSRDPADLKIALEVASGLASLQSPDGWWPHPDQPTYDDSAGSEGKDGHLDVTAEFVGQLGCIALACRAIPGIGDGSALPGHPVLTGRPRPTS